MCAATGSMLTASSASPSTEPSAVTAISAEEHDAATWRSESDSFNDDERSCVICDAEESKSRYRALPRVSDHSGPPHSDRREHPPDHAPEFGLLVPRFGA